MSWAAFCEDGPISAGFYWRKDDDMAVGMESASRFDAVSVLMRFPPSGFLLDVGAISTIGSGGNEIGFRVK